MALIEIDDIFPAIETSIYGWDVPVRYVSHNQTVYLIKIPLNHHKVPLNHPIIGPSALTHPHRVPSPQVPKAWRCASLLDARSSAAPPCRSTCRPRPWWEKSMAELGEPTMFLHFSYRWMILDGKSTMKICREIQSCCFFLIDHGCFFMHKNRWYNGWMYQKKRGTHGDQPPEITKNGRWMASGGHRRSMVYPYDCHSECFGIFTQPWSFLRLKTMISCLRKKAMWYFPTGHGINKTLKSEHPGRASSR